MKKTLSFLLALCMLISLACTVGAAPAFAGVQSVEEFEQLKQRAEAGDAGAMGALGDVYYFGSYNNGISRDFTQALAWFTRAAEAGNTDVYVKIGRLYQFGAAGERNAETAYEWYRLAAELGSEEAQELLEKPVFTEFHWKDNAVALTGTLGQYDVLGGRLGTPFYLDKPVLNCSMVVLQLRIVNYRGWPFGLYGLFAQTLNGDWVEISRFEIEKYQAEEGEEPRTYEFQIAAPLSFKALGVVLLEDGMDFNLSHEDSFFVDASQVGEYSDTIPAPVFTPSGKEYAENAGTYAYTSAWAEPSSPF